MPGRRDHIHLVVNALHLQGYDTQLKASRVEDRVSQWSLSWLRPGEHWVSHSKDLDEIADHVQLWLRNRAGEAVIVKGVSRVT